MKEYLNPYDISNSVRMMRSHFTGIFLLVEGDTDARAYGRFTDRNRCEIIPAMGKDNVLNAMKMLTGRGIKGVLAIVDCDFWRLDGIKPDDPNILTTDTHDLETMMIHSPALDIILNEFGSQRKINSLGTDIRKLLLNTALPLGYLRWISSSRNENLSLRFRDISLSELLNTNDRTMKLDIHKLVDEVGDYSGRTLPEKKIISDRLENMVKANSHDPWHVCRGHDMVDILAVGLRTVFGNRNAKNLSGEAVDKVLRIAFGFAEFSATTLYSSIRDWERIYGTILK
jgi:hypothetical protein